MIIQPTATHPLTIDAPLNQVMLMYSDPQSGGSISVTTQMPGLNVHVASQLPAFVSEDHPKFVQFIEEYYRWMESPGQVLHEARNIKNNRDIDTTTDEYEEHLFNEFLSIIPRYVVADKSTILKYAKQFYTAKGTEKSFKFLFRVLFNSNSRIYYPKTDILKVSDGKWIQNKTLRIISVSGDVKNFRAKKIRGLINNSTAFVERVYGITFNGYQAYELVLNRASITGKFLPGETIVALDGSIKANISPIPESVRIIRKGKNYSVGDRFNLEYVGTGAVLRVAEVDSDGGIKKFYIEEYGVGYSEKNPPSQIRLIDDKHPLYIPSTVTENIDTAIITVVLGSTTNYPGYFRNEDGQPSARKYVHDGYYYQQFSYVTYCDRSYNDYSDALKRIVHPLGFKNFSGVSIESFGSVQTKSTGILPIKILTNRLFGADAKIKTLLTQIVPKTDARSINRLGPNHASIVRDKFSYKPFLKYDAADEMSENNFNYYGPLEESGQIITSKLSSTPVSAFGHEKFSQTLLQELEAGLTFPITKINDIGPRHIERPQNLLRKTNYLPDSSIVLNRDRVTLSTSTPSVVFPASDLTPRPISFLLNNQSDGPVSWKVLINGKQLLLSNTLSIIGPAQFEFQVSFVGSTTTNSTWQFSHHIFGSTQSITVTVQGAEFRVAIFAQDNLSRSYKSDNIGIKYLVDAT